MQAFGEKAKQVGDKFTSVGKEVSKASAVAVAAGAASYKAWSEVDDALDSVAAGTGATGKQLESLQQTAKNVYTTTKDAKTIIIGNMIFLGI